MREVRWPEWVDDAPVWFECAISMPSVGMYSISLNKMPFFYESEAEWGADVFGVSPEKYAQWRDWAKDGCRCRAYYKNGNPCQESNIYGVLPSDFDSDVIPYCNRHKDPASRGRPKVVRLAKPDKKSSKRGSGFIYLMHAEGTPRYKIGLSKDPKERNAAIDGQSPYPVKIIECYSVNDMTEAEGYWHERFHVERVHGEWFELSPSQIEEFVQVAEAAA